MKKLGGKCASGSGDRISKAKVVGVGCAGNTFQLSEADEQDSQGPHDGAQHVYSGRGVLRTDSLLNKQQWEWRGGTGEKGGAETVD